jgi:hypothetical protein
MSLKVRLESYVHNDPCQHITTLAAFPVTPYGPGTVEESFSDLAFDECQADDRHSPVSATSRRCSAGTATFKRWQHRADRNHER